MAFRLLGLALLPVPAAAALATAALFRRGSLTHEFLAFAAGFSLWLVLFHSLPRPFRAYVLAHELTHAVWGFFTGAAVSDLRVSRRGGSVRLSEAGLFATLAPYFLPLYALLLLAVYGIAALFRDPAPWQVIWMAALGAAWGFHVSFTLAIVLETPQPDLKEYGRFFSAVLILAIHLCVLFAAVALLLSASREDALGAWMEAADRLLRWVRPALGALPR